LSVGRQPQAKPRTRRGVRRIGEEASMRDQHHVKAEVIRDRILQLESEHGDLDRLIERMSDDPGSDDLELQRLKKRKLKVKDNIILLQLQLEPDSLSTSDRRV
jgi:hypothetical protein